MGRPRLELAIGDVDGVNTQFSVQAAYTPGTTAVFLNGQLLSDDWEETNDLLLTFQEAPRIGDIVQVYYVDTYEPPPPIGTSGEPIVGMLALEAVPIQGIIALGEEELHGVLDELAVQGTIDEEP